MATPFKNRWPLHMALAAGCAAAPLAMAQNADVRKPRLTRVTSLRHITAESIMYNGVRYPAVAPAGDDSGIVYNNTTGPYNFLNPVDAWRHEALDGFSFSPGPASGVSVLLTSIDVALWVDTPPASQTLDIALSFFNQMDGTATPVNSVPIPGVFTTFGGIGAAGGYVGTLDLAGLPGGGVAIPDDTANGVVVNIFQTGTQNPQAGTSVIFANGAAGAGLPPSVGGSAPGVWGDVNQDNVFGGDEGIVLTGVTNASNLYLKFTGTFTPTAVGACCRADGTCTENQNSAQCATLGGSWAGANVTCAAANCPPPGACCLSAGVCVSTILPVCTAQSGVFSGTGTTCPPTPACAPQYFVDDTTGEVQQGFGAATTATLAWLNRFTVANDLSTITTIQVAFGDNTAGGLNGTPVTVYLWSDPNNDGDPADAAVLASAAGFVANSGTATLNPFAITPTNVGPNGTNFFVGAILTATPPSPGVYAALLDNTTNQGRSWFAGNATGTPVGPTNLGAALVQGNFLVRADATGGGGGCYANCDNSTQTPVLNVADFTCFLTKYAGGNPNNVADPANCDGSTQVPVLNVADFTCFLTKYAGGCP